ncbi:hypothetical protein SUGI_0420420 [Cryptomeria japonica]|nr:hypothetical protein SUGI_0420420 [Cryptomeria japonica]
MFFNGTHLLLYFTRIPYGCHVITYSAPLETELPRHPRKDKSIPLPKLDKDVPKPATPSGSRLHKPALVPHVTSRFRCTRLTDVTLTVLFALPFHYEVFLIHHHQLPSLSCPVSFGSRASASGTEARWRKRRREPKGSQVSSSMNGNFPAFKGVKEFDHKNVDGFHKRLQI